jgi:hypothetical protein
LHLLPPHGCQGPDSLNAPCKGCCKAGRGHVVSCQSIVARCDAPEVSQPVEGTLDAPAKLIEALTEVVRLFASVGNDQFASALVQLAAQLGAIVGLVTEHVLRRLHSAYETLCDRTIVCLASRCAPAAVCSVWIAEGASLRPSLYAPRPCPSPLALGRTAIPAVTCASGVGSRPHSFRACRREPQFLAAHTAYSCPYRRRTSRQLFSIWKLWAARVVPQRSRLLQFTPPDRSQSRAAAGSHGAKSRISRA